MAKNIRYRGGVQPIEEYQKDVANNQMNADREYDGQYRGVEFHHDKSENAQNNAQKNATTPHLVEVQYRGAKGIALIG